MDKIEKKLWRRVSIWSFLLKSVPFVNMIAVSGGLSFGIVDKKSDIDLFVVVKNGRLYTARFFMNVFLMMFGLRVFGENKARKFCLNFFVDERNADLSSIAIKDDIYLAYWIKRLVPIVDRRELKIFEGKNKWALKILGDEKLVIERSRIGWFKSFSFLSRRGLEFVLRGKFGDRFEGFVFRKQKEHLKSSDRGFDAKMGNGIFKMHSPDRREIIRNSYREKFKTGFDEEGFIALLRSKTYL